MTSSYISPDLALMGYSYHALWSRWVIDSPSHWYISHRLTSLRDGFAVIDDYGDLVLVPHVPPEPPEQKEKPPELLTPKASSNAFTASLYSTIKTFRTFKSFINQCFRGAA